MSEQRPMRGIRYPKPRMTPNIVPLVDVLFMMLLFFILGTRFRQAEGILPSTLPPAGVGIAQADAQVLPPIDIRVRLNRGAAGVTYEVSGVPGALESPAALYDALRARKQGQEAGAEQAVFIKPGSDVPWQYVVEADNQALRAKFEKIGFATQNQ